MPVFQNSQILEQFANIGSLSSWYRHIMSCPGICGDLILSQTGLPPCLCVHLQENEILEALLPKSPGCTQPGYAASNNNNRNFRSSLCRRKRFSVAKQMPYRRCFIYKRSFNSSFTF